MYSDSLLVLIKLYLIFLQSTSCYLDRILKDKTLPSFNRAVKYSV